MNKKCDKEYQELLSLMETAPSGEEIVYQGFKIINLLLAKNIAYGNSAIDPVRIFSKANTEEQIRIRIDDKISRFVRGQEYAGDNDVDDLIGYLLLLKVAMSS